ncbi:MAG: hypothetical protein K1Y01_03200 [Vicinamibacteria bacterium]|nr:hypothetical protein [Vicinamibacteria bacterium]
MRSRFREWGGRVLLLALSTFLGLLAVEAAARALVWNWTREPGVVRHPFARFDPDLGWSKPENASGILRRSEYRVALKINSSGLRGPDIPLAKPPGVKRVLLLGDSFTEGYTVEEPLTVRARLEKELSSALSTPVQVINGGTAGWGTDQEVLFYEKSGRAYAPDVVVLLFYYNDIYRDGDLRIQPWFDLDETGSLVLNNSPVKPHEEFYRAEPFSIKPFRGSMALALLQPRLDSHPRVARALSMFGLADPPAGLKEIPEEFHPFGRQRPREVRRHWQRIEALLGRLDASVSKDGARLMLFYVPARFEVDDAAWSLTRQVYGLNAQWDRNRVADELGRIAHDLDLPIVDPRAAFRSSEAKAASTYFPEDGHWTEAGNEVAAKEILAAIRKRLILSPP